MPIYEYQCQACGHRLEALQRMSDAPLSECKECGGDLKKLISAPAFQFKGTGWYVTDYAKKDGKGEKGESRQEGSSSGEGSSESGKDSTAKTESKGDGASSGSSKSGSNKSGSGKSSSGKSEGSA